jgi:hypothetical protein
MIDEFSGANDAINDMSFSGQRSCVRAHSRSTRNGAAAEEMAGYSSVGNQSND